MKTKLHLRSEQGQMLIIAMSVLLLLLLGFTTTFFLTRMQGSIHQRAGEQRRKARAVAEEGIAYASQQLSASTTTWQNALQGNFSNTDCNTGIALSSPSGGYFKLFCSTGTLGNPNLQLYQVAVKSIALTSGGTTSTRTPIRAIRAYLSKRTLGIDTASGIHTAAALQLVRQPLLSSPPGNLIVHWGPIVCLDSSDANSWHLIDPIDSSRYPRKYSSGGIHGTTYSRSGSTWGSGPITDQTEYWAYTSQVFPPIINEAKYQWEAAHTNISDVPKNGSGNDIPRNCPYSGHSQCGYFEPNPGDTAIFDDTGSGYSAPSGSFIFVDGNAEFRRMSIANASFVITGDLTITDHNGGDARNIHVPVYAAAEYPYYPSTPTTWPCMGKQGNMSGNSPANDCGSSSVFPSPGKIHYQGFLYVKGNLRVTADNWNMVGALLIGDMQATPGTGGQLQIPVDASLNLAFDDSINHKIFMNSVGTQSIKVVPDVILDVPL